MWGKMMRPVRSMVGTGMFQVGMYTAQMLWVGLLLLMTLTHCCILLELLLGAGKGEGKEGRRKRWGGGERGEGSMAREEVEGGTGRAGREGMRKRD